MDELFFYTEILVSISDELNINAHAGLSVTIATDTLNNGPNTFTEALQSPLKD